MANAISDQYPDNPYRDSRDYDMGEWYVSQDSMLMHSAKQPTQIIYSVVVGLTPTVIYIM